ncbi:Intradiol ring-cleavage dioxygenase [Pestalotiopsis sp. NC0098]|nr:Intradiol ring-cleavage dioxygenase [Pestalotiopsis sp. NC0098]
MRFIQVAAPLAVFANAAIAHGNHDIREEIKERRDFLATQKRTSLSHCSDKLKARGLDRRNIARRAVGVQEARVKRQVQKRTEDEVLATNHNKTSSAYTENTAADTLFADYQSCLLTPMVTQGPYYVADEYVRRQISEDLEGVPIVMDFQVVDINTCEPMPNTYLEIWHANATGVYAGVEVEGNGSGESDPGNLNKTWGRGIQETNADGVAQFESIFPGHYTGRAIHIHTVVHKNATLYENSTLGAETITSHIGQVFFDQDLISLVEDIYPYNTNEQDLTTNADDSIMATETETDGVDPVMEYVMLGDSVEDGIFAWVSFGINSTYSKVMDPVVYLTEDGGVDNPNWDDEDGRP